MAVLTAVTLVTAMAGCGRSEAPRSAPSAQPSAPSTSATEFATALEGKVTADAMLGHLKKLQEIADANKGTRALGTPGYAASVDYVANALKDYQPAANGGWVDRWRLRFGIGRRDDVDSEEIGRAHV